MVNAQPWLLARRTNPFANAAKPVCKPRCLTGASTKGFHRLSSKLLAAWGGCGHVSSLPRGPGVSRGWRVPRYMHRCLLTSGWGTSLAVKCGCLWGGEEPGQRSQLSDAAPAASLSGGYPGPAGLAGHKDHPPCTYLGFFLMHPRPTRAPPTAVSRVLVPCRSRLHGFLKLL